MTRPRVAASIWISPHHPTAAEARAFIDDPAPGTSVPGSSGRCSPAPPTRSILARVFDVMLLERRSAMGGSTVDVPPASWRAYLAGAFAENRPWIKWRAKSWAATASMKRRARRCAFMSPGMWTAHSSPATWADSFSGWTCNARSATMIRAFSGLPAADYYGLYAFF